VFLVWGCGGGGGRGGFFFFFFFLFFFPVCLVDEFPSNSQSHTDDDHGHVWVIGQYALDAREKTRLR
jgi:hypothetical protein